MNTNRATLVIVGAGIVGLATAWHASRRWPDLKVIVVEKERELARHQSGHNSGVVHSGVYYVPGSAKARHCLEGRAWLHRFCSARRIPWETCGKVIVAADQTEREGLSVIAARGVANGVRCEVIGPERLVEIEPHVHGVEALHVPGAAITDSVAVCRALAIDVEGRGGRLRFGVHVEGIDKFDRGPVVQTSHGPIPATHVVNCAGLHSDQLAPRRKGGDAVRIIPFRGEYFTLASRSDHLCQGLIYPVPDPRFPFLGVHLTRRVDGRVDLGPNAVLATSREGYERTSFRARDVLDTWFWPGMVRVGLRHFGVGVREFLRAGSPEAFAEAARRLVPEVVAKDLQPAPSGVRAQAITRDGRLIDDFVFADERGVTHVVNAPSPAATSSLSIASALCDRFGPSIERHCVRDDGFDPRRDAAWETTQ
jgi:L-2-hydroxyglutarate oxidase